MNEARLESFVKLVGLAGALIAAFTGIYQFWQSNLQNSRELRWKQAQTAREMIDKMVGDEGRVYVIGGNKIKINVRTVYTALEKEKSNDLDRHIIDRLDRTFFMVSQLESAVRSDLVRVEDVRFPLTWYAGKRMCPRKQLFEDYMKEHAAPETLQFFQRLDEWRNCSKQ